MIERDLELDRIEAQREAIAAEYRLWEARWAETAERCRRQLEELAELRERIYQERDALDALGEQIVRTERRWMEDACAGR